MPPPPTPPPPPNRRYSPLELAILSTPLLIGIGAGWYYSDAAHDAVGVTAIGVTAALGYIGLSILGLAAYATLYTLAVTGYAWVVAVIVMIVLGWALGDYLPRGFLIGAAITAPVAFFVGRAIEKEDAAARAKRDE